MEAQMHKIISTFEQCKEEYWRAVNLLIEELETLEHLWEDSVSRYFSSKYWHSYSDLLQDVKKYFEIHVELLLYMRKSVEKFVLDFQKISDGIAKIKANFPRLEETRENIINAIKEIEDILIRSRQYLNAATEKERDANMNLDEATSEYSRRDSALRTSYNADEYDTKAFSGLGFVPQLY